MIYHYNGTPSNLTQHHGGKSCQYGPDSWRRHGCDCNAGDPRFLQHRLWSRWIERLQAILALLVQQTLQPQLYLGDLDHLEPWDDESMVASGHRGASLHGHHLCFLSQQSFHGQVRWIGVLVFIDFHRNHPWFSQKGLLDCGITPIYWPWHRSNT